MKNTPTPTIAASPKHGMEFFSQAFEQIPLSIAIFWGGGYMPFFGKPHDNRLVIPHSAEPSTTIRKNKNSIQRLKTTLPRPAANAINSANRFTKQR